MARSRPHILRGSRVKTRSHLRMTGNNSDQEMTAMIKDLIVNLSLGKHDPSGDFAISVADAFRAHVLGVAFSYEPVIPGTVMGGIPPQFIEGQRAESQGRARKAVARFTEAAK